LLPFYLESKIVNFKIQGIKILPAVLYGRDSLSYLEKNKTLRGFQNRVLRRIFGTERQVDGDKSVFSEVHNLYLSPNIFRVIRPGITKLGRTCNTYQGDNKYIQSFGHKIA
jgi:hypothetical protein